MRVRRTVVAIVTAAALLGCSGGSGSGGGGVSNPEAVSQAVTNLMQGSEEFASVSASLTSAAASGDPNAKLVKAVADFLDYLKTTGTQPGGTLYGLCTSAGLVPAQPGAPFWSFKFVGEAHGQGAIKNSAPDLNEVRDFLVNDLRPRLTTLVSTLDSTPANFELVVPVTSSPPLSGPFLPGAGDYILDYGDLMAVASNVYVLQAWIDFIVAINWDNVHPDDFDYEDLPFLNEIRVIEQSYPSLGEIHNNELLYAKLDLQAGWQRYRSASAHLRSETPQQQGNGILTLGLSTFETAQEQAQFLADEQAFRNWAQPIVDAFETNLLYEITTDPRGMPLPIEDREEINFYKFFQGVSPREIYFKVVTDPLNGDRILGVNSLSEIDSSMLNFGGVIGRVQGQLARAGDLQDAYAVRVDSPPTSTKVIDGSFTEWQSNREQIAASTAVVDPRDLGRLYVAKDATKIYLYLDRVLSNEGFYYSISVRSGFLHEYLDHYAGSTYQSSGVVSAFSPGQGIELSVDKTALGSPAWVRIKIEVRDSWYSIISTRDDMLVRVQ